MLDNVSYVTSLMFVSYVTIVSCPKPGCVLHTEVTAFIFFINFPELRKSVEEKIFQKKKKKKCYRLLKQRDLNYETPCNLFHAEFDMKGLRSSI